MRLGFVSARWASRSEGALYADAGMGRLIDALRARAGGLTVALSVVRAGHDFHDHRLSIDAADVVELPEMLSFRHGFHQHRACADAIRRVEERCDVLIVQTPFTAATALIPRTKPRLYHVCADVYGIVAESQHYRGIWRAASLGAAFGVDRLYRRLFTRPGVRLVTNGRALLDRYRPAMGIASVSTSLHASEIASVLRQRNDDRFRILFVGHLRPEKGFTVLLEAFQRISSQLPNAELSIVGPSSFTQSDVATGVADLASQHERVKLAGNLPFGPRLFQCYADADVLALPSFSEGTPRVLIEARAFGCPVIASNVGGIPTSVEHDADGILVPPRDVDALANAILRLARDPELRRRLSETGLLRARERTIESFAESLYAEASLMLARGR